uniref:hypothetical protein n=2 Tax=Mariniflexile sp. TaxID=1979402 RepID=UPI0040471C0C
GHGFNVKTSSFPGAKVVFQFSFTEQPEFNIKQPNINYMRYCGEALPMAIGAAKIIKSIKAFALSFCSLFLLFFKPKTNKPKMIMM